jgi:hypothetical protein
VKLLKKIFISLVMVVFATLSAFGAENCMDEQYRRLYPEKCPETTNVRTVLTLVGGAALVGSGVAFALQSAGNSGSSSSNQTNYTRTPLSSKIVNNYSLSDNIQNKKIDAVYLNSASNGNDIDTNTINAIKATNEYQKNNRQYNAINFAWATARNYTGKNVNINVLDNFYSEHGSDVHYIASHIAPDANVTNTNLGTSSDSFGSFNYMANAIKNSASADVYNASWQIPSTSGSNAATVIYNSNGSTKTYAAAQQYMYDLAGENFITQIRNSAVDNDAIFVWAAGNEYQEESGALSAMPLAFPDLNGHFVNVVALDNYDEIAWFSNQCGITQNYCIAAPGVGWKTDTSTYVNGTSFATPVVSGAIATIKEKFPYLNASTITQILFTTATDLGDPGVDSVYGWGLLDMEKATNPVGTPTIILANETIRPLSVSHIGGSAAPAIQKANVKMAFFDDFGRAFTTNLSDNIKVVPYGRGFDKLRESENDSVVFDKVEFGFSQNHLLESSGLVSVQSNQITNFVGYKNEFNFKGIGFYQNARFGITNPTASEESMVSGFSNVYTSSVKMGATWNDFALEVAIPETIVSGDMYLNVPTGRNAQGDVIYNRASVDLSTTRPSTEYTVKYKYLSATYVENPDYEDEFFIMAKTKVAF